MKNATYNRCPPSPVTLFRSIHYYTAVQVGAATHRVDVGIRYLHKTIVMITTLY